MILHLKKIEFKYEMAALIYFILLVEVKVVWLVVREKTVVKEQPCLYDFLSFFFPSSPENLQIVFVLIIKLHHYLLFSLTSF